MYHKSDIDEIHEKQLTQAYDLLTTFGLRTHNDVFEVVLSNGKVIAASFVGCYDNTVDFDIVVSENVQRQGVATDLVENILSCFDDMGATFTANCVNPHMADLLEKKFTFKCERQICDTKHMYRD